MKKMGWEPKSAYERLESTINWTLKNDRWLSYLIFLKGN